MKNKLYPHICENPECGKRFFGRKNAKFCCVECHGIWKLLSSEKTQGKVQVESLLKRRKREEMRQRMALREIEYARHAAPVKVEERGGVRIETRGQMCIGWRSSDKVSHL